MLAGLEGRLDLREPSNWDTVYGSLQSNTDLAHLSDQIAQRFGNAEAAKKMMAVIRNPESGLDQKQNAIKNLALHQREELEKELPQLLNDPDLRMESIRAIAAFENEDLGRALFELYPTLSGPERQEAILTLASRGTYGRILAEAIKEGNLPKKDIPAYVAMMVYALMRIGEMLRRKARKLDFKGMSGLMVNTYGSKLAGYVAFAGAVTFLIPYIAVQISGISIFLNAAFPDAIPVWAWSFIIVGIMILYSETGGLRAIMIIIGKTGAQMA